MKKPKAINLYIDLYKRFEKFSDAQAGRLVKAMLRYGNTGEITDFSDDLALDVTFCGITDQIDRDFEKYRDICQKRSEIGRRGAQALHQKDQANDEEEENKNKAQSARPSHLIPLEYIADVHAVIDHLNQHTGTRIRVSNLGNGKMITNQLKKGYTVEDCKRVIDNECDRLMALGYHKDLLSMFLFGSHFEEYAARSA